MLQMRNKNQALEITTDFTLYAALWLHKDYKSVKSKIASCSGLYFMFNEENEFLYIGKASYMRERLHSHLTGKSNTKHFISEVHRVEVISRDSFDSVCDSIQKCFNLTIEDEVDLEYFFIKTGKPKYNKTRKDHSLLKSHYDEIKVEQTVLDEALDDFYL